VDAARSRWIERSGSAAETSKSRWRGATPDTDLTWGLELPGDPFIEVADRHDGFGPERTVLEVGPGYGRLAAAAIERASEFERWIALDISAEVVRHIEARFADARIEVRRGDVETAELDEQIDTVLSSLTFKHLYPDFGAALANLRPALGPDSVVIFDLIEGERRYFQYDGMTYVRAYSRDEVKSIVDRAGFELAGFDEVAHDAEHRRLVVVAMPRAGS
jgi:SAM-dependent methyltransferase